MAETQTAPAPSGATTPNYGAPTSMLPGAVTAPVSGAPATTLAPTAALPAATGATSAPATAVLPPQNTPGTAAAAPSAGMPPGVTVPPPVPEPSHENIDRFLQASYAYKQESLQFYNSQQSYKAESTDRFIATRIKTIENVLSGRDQDPGATRKFEEAVRDLLHSEFEFEHLYGRPGYNPGGIKRDELESQGAFEAEQIAQLSGEVMKVLEARRAENARQAQVFAQQEKETHYQGHVTTLATGLLDAYGRRVDERGNKIEVEIDGTKRPAWNVRIGNLETYITKDRDGGYVFAVVPPAGGKLQWQSLPASSPPLVSPDGTPAQPQPGESFEVSSLRLLMTALRDIPKVPREHVAVLDALEEQRKAREGQNSSWKNSKLAGDTLLELMQPEAVGEEVYRAKWGTHELHFRRTNPTGGRIEYSLDDKAWTSAETPPFATDTTNLEERSINARISLLNVTGRRDADGNFGGFDRIAVAQAKEGKVTEAIAMLDTAGESLMRDVLAGQKQPDGSYRVACRGYAVDFKKNDRGLWEWRQAEPAPTPAQPWTDVKVHYTKGNYPTVPSNFAFFNRTLYFLDRINQAEGEIAAMPARPAATPATPPRTP